MDQYDTECVPEAFRSNKVAYIKDNSIPKNCSRLLKVIFSLETCFLSMFFDIEALVSVVHVVSNNPRNSI